MLVLGQDRAQVQAGLAHALAEGGIEQGTQTRGQGVQVARVRQDKAVPSIGHDLAGAVEASADDRQAHGQGFQHHQAARVVTGGQEKKVGGVIEGGKDRAWDRRR